MPAQNLSHDELYQLYQDRQLPSFLTKDVSLEKIFNDYPRALSVPRFHRQIEFGALLALMGGVVFCGASLAIAAKGGLDFGLGVQVILCAAVAVGGWWLGFKISNIQSSARECRSDLDYLGRRVDEMTNLTGLTPPELARMTEIGMRKLSDRLITDACEAVLVFKRAHADADPLTWEDDLQGPYEELMGEAERRHHTFKRAGFVRDPGKAKPLTPYYDMARARLAKKVA